MPLSRELVTTAPTERREREWWCRELWREEVTQGMLGSPRAIQESRVCGWVLEGGPHRDEERTGFTSSISLLGMLGQSKSRMSSFCFLGRGGHGVWQWFPFGGFANGQRVPFGGPPVAVWLSLDQCIASASGRTRSRDPGPDFLPQLWFQISCPLVNQWVLITVLLICKRGDFI